ncbi:MAG: branched-chain amino acid ABC transporter permease [Clostridia bacterium]|nr:branched-chain amino acid ABC transporter permease [Clostridia bacterium]
MKNIKWKHYINYILIGAVTLIFTILAFAGALERSLQVNLEQIAIAMMLAVSLSLVVGFLGELSIGHAGFMCVGAYLGGKISAILVPILGNGLLALAASLLVGGLCAGICGFIIGLPALRLKGDYLAITTLAFGEIVRVIFLNSSSESFGGALGLPTPRFDRKYLFIICFLMVLLTLFVVQNLIRSKHGRAITAIRDNEIAARATGINVTKYKLVGFIVAAIFAGFAGVLFSYTQPNVSSITFNYNYSIEMLVIVVLGGMGNLTGSLIAAAAVTLINSFLQAKLPGDLAVLKDLLYALILIVVVVYSNSPALKNFRDKYNLRNLFAKFSKNKHDSDDASRWDVVPTKIKMDAILSTDIVVNDPQADKADKPKGDK